MKMLHALWIWSWQKHFDSANANADYDIYLTLVIVATWRVWSGLVFTVPTIYLTKNLEEVVATENSNIFLNHLIFEDQFFPKYFEDHGLWKKLYRQFA